MRPWGLQVFQLSDGSYQIIFRFLWQLKRVEYSLSNFRKEQTCLLKRLQRKKDFSGIYFVYLFNQESSLICLVSLDNNSIFYWVLGHDVIYFVIHSLLCVECAYVTF